MKAKKSSRFRVSRADVEAGKQAPRPVAPILELLTSPPSGLGRLQVSASGQRLHPRLLVDTQDRLSRRPVHVQPNDPPHLLVEVRIRTVTPTPDPMRLELRLLQDPADLAAADLLHQPRLHQSMPKALVGPGVPVHTQSPRRLASGRNDLMTLKGGDDSRPTRSGLILQPGHPTLFESMQPVGHPKSARSHLPGDLGNRFSTLG
jgi:hypothetical protein